jgi:lipopolysaccharide/colanic/teichoic acid biosynthesis glycosyltransferase
MALVGPRPEIPAYVAKLARAYRPVLELRPGVTDWASLAFRDEEQVLAAHAGDPSFYATRLLPRKPALARLYRRRRSLGLDLCLILATACVAVGADGSMRRLVGERFLRRARRGLLPDSGG